MRNSFINTIIGAAERREDIFIITGDSGVGVFDNYQKRPDAGFLNMGVAEQNMISFASGLSLTGYKVFIYNIIPFVLYRCYEQVRNDICYQDLPVTLIGIGSGITYAPQGMTHYSLEDIGIAQTLPNLKVLSPIDPVEAKLSAEYALNSDSPVYIRLAKRGEPTIHKKEHFDISRPQLIDDGGDVVVIFHGSIGSEVMKARDILRAENISPKIISLPMVLPFSFENIAPLLKGARFVFTVEEHFINTGLGAILAKEHARRSLSWKLFNLGIPDGYIHEIKDLENMRDHFGISGRKIAESIKNLRNKYE